MFRAHDASTGLASGLVRALVWHGPGNMAVEIVDEPRRGDDEVIVQPEAAGICGSEIEGYLGRMANRTPPLVMGHEFAGTVAAASAAGSEWSGRRVAVNPLLSCRLCARCKAGERNLCAQRRLIGVQVAGGFAERVAVPAANLVALPDRVDARTGALVEPLANAVHALGRESTCDGEPDTARRADDDRDAALELHDGTGERNVLSCAVGPAASVAKASGPASSGSVRARSPRATFPLASRSSAAAKSASVYANEPWSAT